MFSSPTPASGSRTIAASALKSAGLIDQDTKMRDLNDKPGRKGSSKIKSHRVRPIDAFKDRGPTSLTSKNSLSGRISALSSDALSIRGAGNTANRSRRNAVSSSASASHVVVHSPLRRTKVVENWREIVQRRWNQEQRFLNLSSLKDDELVIKYKLITPGSGGTAKDAAVIFKLAAELKPEIISLDLSNNNLMGTHLSYLNHYLPRLANLSLHNNTLRYKDLDAISSRKDKLIHLRELILTQNPARDEQIEKNGLDGYRTEMGRLWPSINMLDLEPIAQIAFDIPEPSAEAGSVPKPSAKTFPVEMQGSLIAGVESDMVSRFLVRFFTTFDTQRTSLLDIYANSCSFSLCCNTSIPERARLQGLQHNLPNQRKLTWGPWLTNEESGSRNLTRLSSNLDKQMKRLHTTPESVIASITTLPSTKHDINGPPEMFSLDCFPVAHDGEMALMLTVHGQFTELPVGGLRSFDRTLILVQAPAGSRAKLAGWEMMVVSDMWTVRGYSSAEAWRPGPMLVQAQTRQQKRQQETHKPKFSPEEEAVLTTVPEPQRSMVVEVSKRTNLNVKYSIDCLTGNNWEIEKAVANFLQVKGTLPRDAFL